MKNVIMLLVALFVVWFIWGFILRFVSMAITIGLIALFCFLVYNVYKALTRQKSIL